MQKASDGGSFSRGKFVHMTPRSLRGLADKLENLSKDLAPNEAATIEITNGLYAYYEPSLDGKHGPMVVKEAILGEDTL